MPTNYDSDMSEDMEFQKELMQVFITEFGDLLSLYKSALSKLRRKNGDKDQAIKDIFRVFHTLKGDSGYFDEFANFTSFTSNFCETLRGQDSSILNNEKIKKTISINYSRLSSVYNAIVNGGKLNAFQFNSFDTKKVDTNNIKDTEEYYLAEREEIKYNNNTEDEKLEEDISSNT